VRHFGDKEERNVRKVLGVVVLVLGKEGPHGIGIRQGEGKCVRESIPRKLK
jgi:hypothetical protein